MWFGGCGRPDSGRLQEQLAGEATDFEEGCAEHCGDHE